MFSISNGREHFYQWDINQQLVVQDNTITEAHFCNRTDDCALICEVFEKDGRRLVNVPNILLQDNWPIRVYAYSINHTKVCATFKVKPRSKPADYVYTETEVKNWEELEARVDEKLAQVDELAEQAAASFESVSAAVTEAYNASGAAWGAANDAILATQYIKENRVANALVGSASGEMVVLDDVSPIAHEMAVSVRKKNLCNVASITGEEDAAGNIYLHDIKKHGTYTASADVTLYEDDTATNPSFSIQILYTDYTHNSGAYSHGITKDGITRRYTATVTTDSTKEIKWVRIIALNYSKENGRHAKAENIQLEVGATATPYAPYVEDVSSVKVNVLGKNLATAQQIHEGNTRYEVVEFDGRTCVKFVDNVINSRAVIPFKPNTQYTVSFDARVVKWQDINNRIRSCLFTFFYSDGTSNNFTKDRNEAWEHCTFTSTAGKTVVGVGNTSYDSVNFNYIDINSFQLEESPIETEYEPYKEPVTYAQGEPINSIYPSTTLITDTAGAVIDATYNKDTNKVISEIYNAIISLGGNV